MSARAGGRGKKRDIVPADTHGQERGQRHVPNLKAKRLSDEGDDDNVFTTEEEGANDTVSALPGSGRQRSSDQSIARRLLTPPLETQHMRARYNPKAKEVVVDVGGEDDEPLESCPQRNAVMHGATTTTIRARGATNERPPQSGLASTPSQSRPLNTVDEGGSIKHDGGGEVQQEARLGGGGGSLLRVDDKVFWTTGEGGRLYNIVHETREYSVAIVSGLQALVVPQSVVMRKSSTKLTRIVEPAQLPQVISRVAAMENIALPVLQGWIFKSRNCPRGYNLAFQYALESVATGIARAMWYDEEWSNVVSVVVCAQTIDLSMDLPLRFTGTNIEDTSEDDDMAAYQESTVICITHAFCAAVQMGANVDGGFISHDRLSRVDGCFRLLLAAGMWLMRMAGDDLRSHYEAFYFAKLVSKPTLVASMHR
ncbi:hypothetical protein CBR_g2863 [Chara braunii]|uniref:Uncharacterized protein n=1 Tax=Chara braunii TaxID=69332 RepID=A0A388KE34_CHABU|nr:hypothetical protein CBR_g2863 [Chara braunii]|eukprot:GBG68318.1 hypothetical protein CBR_g2863 [Chara braunii]